MSCQKVVNVLAVSSAAVSLAVVGSVGYVLVNKDAIVEDVKEQVMDGVLGGLGAGSTGLGVGGSALPTGANALSPTTNPAADTQAAL